jgi:DNA adenine methylase
MKYMGSKARIAKYILPIIQERLADYNIHTYVEPFSGGMNMIDKVKCEHKIASDNNEYLIEIFKNMDKLESMLPEMVSKEHYDECRQAYHNKDFSNFPQWYIGAIGFLASYNGRSYSGGYSGVVHTKAGTVRNYYDEAKRNLLDQLPYLQNVQFQYGDYEDLYSDKIDCLFYCDIPYRGVKQYETSKNFDYDRFWNWAEKMSEKNIVLVSEHEAPSEWECIWQQEVKRTIDNNKRVKAVEKLFEMRE